LALRVDDFHWKEWADSTNLYAEQHGAVLASVYFADREWHIEWLILGHKDTCHPTLSEAKAKVEEAARGCVRS